MTITIDPESEPGRALDETALPDLLHDAAREPISLERDGERFRLSRDEDLAEEPDPEAVRPMLVAIFCHAPRWVARQPPRHTPRSPATKRSSRV